MSSDSASRGVTIRRATSDDLDTVVDLRLALLREYSSHPIYGRLRHDAERRARPMFAAQLDSDVEAMFLAEDNHAPVGLIRCVESVSSPLLVPDRYCYVSSAYVRPQYRRRGVLRELFLRARAWCEERGLTEMRLHNVGSRPASAAAWEALGFEVVEQVRVLRLSEAESVSGLTDVADAPPARTMHP